MQNYLLLKKPNSKLLMQTKSKLYLLMNIYRFLKEINPQLNLDNPCEKQIMQLSLLEKYLKN